MAFDAGILRAVLRETEKLALDGRVDKIYQPERDEIVFVIRAAGTERRLLINAGSSCPRMNITTLKPENPTTPPMFCMMLRKHFAGARLVGVSQPGFERVARLTFECHDDLGFNTNKHVICEIMGKYSNIILIDEHNNIVDALKRVDFTMSSQRLVLPNIKYDLPPQQDKLSILSVTGKEIVDKAFEK